MISVADWRTSVQGIADWWGWDLEAERTRALRLAAFEKAAEFARIART